MGDFFCITTIVRVLCSVCRHNVSPCARSECWCDMKNIPRSLSFNVGAFLSFDAVVQLSMHEGESNYCS